LLNFSAEQDIFPGCNPGDTDLSSTGDILTGLVWLWVTLLNLGFRVEVQEFTGDCFVRTRAGAVDSPLRFFLRVGLLLRLAIVLPPRLL